MKYIYIMGGRTSNYSNVVFKDKNYDKANFNQTTLQLTKFFHTHLKNNNLEDKFEVKLVLSKMEDDKSNIVTNEDVSNFLNNVIADSNTKGIIFNMVMADFEEIEDLVSGKLIGRIRKQRKDIFTVGFCNTWNESEQLQYVKGLKLMKDNSLNLVFANDSKTSNNMIIVPEESRYKKDNAEKTLELLVKMMTSRMQDKFTRSTVVEGDSIDWNGSLVPESLRRVVNHCIAEGAYKPFQGKTVGHFAVKVKDGIILTSKRKTNFNDLDNIGLVKIESDGNDNVIAYGAKPSVGGQSQRIIFDEHPNFDCIAHFHCPVKMEYKGNVVPVQEQWAHECGSHQCGQNTSAGLKKVDLGEGESLMVVYLDEHGPNIVFNRSTNPDKIISFIDKTFDLSAKTGGMVI